MNILEIGKEIGKDIGIEMGKELGEKQKLISQIQKKLDKGCTIEEIAEMLEETVEVAKTIVEELETNKD